VLKQIRSATNASVQLNCLVCKLQKYLYKHLWPGHRLLLYTGGLSKTLHLPRNNACGRLQCVMLKTFVISRLWNSFSTSSLS